MFWWRLLQRQCPSSSSLLFPCRLFLLFLCILSSCLLLSICPKLQFRSADGVPVPAFIFRTSLDLLAGLSVCPGNRGDGQFVRLSLCWGWHVSGTSPVTCHHCHHFIFLTHSSSPLVSLFTGVPVSWSSLRTSRVHGGLVQLLLFSLVRVFHLSFSPPCWSPPPRFLCATDWLPLQ